MSTFDGLVKEFPTIRIDYFRNHPNEPSPAALFLSHVHSDHLLGLETVKMPFIYCSATTKRILLKMEKYPHRINFAKGILEKRKQHYKHMKNILREIPLNICTKIELSPKVTIHVTLIDANHCPGAVMFLIEGDGKAVLYTGDVRAEPWWVNSIKQTPILLPYACGLKRLECVYLDTTFATHDEPYREFPTKAEGLRELLDQVRQYPPTTIFYFRSWTLGYEDVWVALSNFLKSQIHVNEYQLGIFRDGTDQESFALAGFTLGNREHPGCLTLDKVARIHSCEPGLPCFAEIKKLKNVVWISPIISRLKDGTEIRELGAGGGWKDLYPTAQIKLEESVTIQLLLNLFASAVIDDETKFRLYQSLGQFGNIRDLARVLDSSDEVKIEEDHSIKPNELLMLLAKVPAPGKDSISAKRGFDRQEKIVKATNNTIHFPYSRHSSYSELRHLVETFRPKDICPCTVSPEDWTEDLSMQALFGDLCDGQTFYYDQETRELVAEYEARKELINASRGKRKRDDDEDDTQRTASQNSYHYGTSSPVVFTSPVKPDSQAEFRLPHRMEREEEDIQGTLHHQDPEIAAEVDLVPENQCPDQPDSEFDSQLLSSSVFDSQPIELLDPGGAASASEGTSGVIESDHRYIQLLESDSTAFVARLRRKQARCEAYDAARMAVLDRDSTEWDAVALSSVGHRRHTEDELEL